MDHTSCFPPAAQSFLYKHKLTALVWVLVVAALIYLFMRYVFSDERRSAYAEMKREFVAIQRRKVLNELKKQYQAHKKSGKPAPYFADDGAQKLQDVEEGQPNFIAFNTTPGAYGAVQFKLDHWEGLIPFNTEIDKFQAPAVATVEFNVDRWSRTRITATAAVEMLFWSKGVTSILTPWLLGVVATVFAIYRLVTVI